MIEENDGYLEFVEPMSKGSDVEVERTMQRFLATARRFIGRDPRQVEMLECGTRRALEARRKGRPRQESAARRRGTARRDASDEVRTVRGTAGLVRGGDERQSGGKREHGSKGRLGSKGTPEVQQNTRTMKGADEDEEEEEHEEECDCWDNTHCCEYIDDEGVQRGPFTNSEMKDWWEKLRLPKNLHFRPCDARVSANMKRGSRQVAFHILKDGVKHAPTVFAISHCAENASASLRGRMAIGRARGGRAGSSGA